MSVNYVYPVNLRQSDEELHIEDATMLICEYWRPCFPFPVFIKKQPQVTSDGNGDV